MMCGRYEMPWMTLRELSGFVVHEKLSHVLPYSELGNPDPESGSGWSIRRMTELREQLKQMAMIDLMQMTNRMLCFDPRDKVYGLCGVNGVFRVMDASRQEIALEVDYKKTVAQVYIEAARFFLSQPNGLGLLANIFFEPKVTGPPSRVPDWTGDSGFFRLSREQPFTASGRTRLFLQIADAGNRIGLPGIQVDHISYVSGEILSSVFNPILADQCGRWLRERLERIRGSDKYSDAVDVLWSTLTANAFAVNPPGPDEGSAAALGGLRMFCMTDKGYCRLVLPRSRAGDYVAIVRGGMVPWCYVLSLEKSSCLSVKRTCTD